VFLTVQDRDEIVTVEAFESSQQISLRAAIGERRPMYCTASGKAILAHLSESDTNRIVQRGMPTITPRTITSPVVLQHNLEEVRTRGYAWDDEERYEGVRCVAAPIFDATGKVIAATSLAAPLMRTSWERLEQLGLEVRAVSQVISGLLGFTEGHSGEDSPLDKGSIRAVSTDMDSPGSETEDGIGMKSISNSSSEWSAS
jgi:DNA-binding IclR family transcriptional regulator